MILSYTAKSFFRRKRYAIVSLVASVLFITSLSTALSLNREILNTYSSYLNKNYGQYTLVTHSLPSEFNEDQPVVVGTAALYDVSISSEATEKECLVGYLDPTALSLSPIHLASGRLPENEDEIAVESFLFDQKELGEIGSVFYLVPPSETDGTPTRVTIVGVVENYSAFQEMSGWPQAIIGAPSTHLSETSFESIVKVKETKHLQSVIERISDECFLSPRYSENSFDRFLDRSILALTKILTVSLILLAFLCLFAFNSVGNTLLKSQINDLRLVNASSGQIYLFVFLNSLLLYAISIPGGLALGTLIKYLFISQAISPQVKGSAFHIDWGINLFCAIMSFFFLLAGRIIYTARVISDGTKLDEDNLFPVRPGSAIINRVPSVLVKWELCKMKKRIGLYAGIIGALVLCLLTLFFGGFFSQTVSYEYDVEFPDQFELMDYNGSCFSFLVISENPNYGFNHSEITQIEAIPEISNVSYSTKTKAILEDRDRKVSSYSQFIDVKTDFKVSDEDYQDELQRYGITTANNLYSINLCSCNETFLQQLLIHSLQKNEFNPQTSVVLTCKDKTTCPYSPGDTICFYMMVASHGSFTPAEEVQTVFLEMLVYDVIEIPDSNQLSKKYVRAQFQIVCAEQALLARNINLGITNMYINLKDVKDNYETRLAIEQLRHLHPSMSVISEIDSAIEKRAIIGTLTSTVIFLSAFAFFTCFINVYNTLTAAYLREHKIWGTLRAIGLNNTTTIVMHCIEMLSVALAAVLISVLFVFLAGKVIRRDVVLFNTPYILGCVLCPLLLCGMTLPLARLPFKQTILSQINNVE